MSSARVVAAYMLLMYCHILPLMPLCHSLYSRPSLQNALWHTAGLFAAYTYSRAL